MIRLLIASGRPELRSTLARMVGEAPDLVCVGQAETGPKTIFRAFSLRPDLIVMDAELPGVDTVRVTKEIMKRWPIPIAILSSEDSAQSQDLAFDALAAGAVDVVASQAIDGSSDRRAQLLEALRATASVAVGRPHDVLQEASSEGLSSQPWLGPVPELIAIGAGVGGPSAMAVLLRELPDTSPPIVIVQAMTSGFQVGFHRWLQARVPRAVVGTDGMRLQRGMVVLCPEGYCAHVSEKATLRLRPSNCESRQCMDELFESVASRDCTSSVGLLLSGMGTAGVQGLGAMKRAGALTIAQDPRSAVVASMPKAAVAQSAARIVRSLPELSCLFGSI